MSKMIQHKRAVQNRLLKWFDQRERDLPWLRPKTPYRVWVSEIMLQQTQIKTVIGYFDRFMMRFPTVGTLAAAEIDEVLKFWEGLGYYRRARQLHKASQVVVDQHDGKFPEQFDDVLALPGVGRYTAAAILSIACDQSHAILEGNTIRLFARWMALDSDTTQSANQKLLWQFSESMVSRRRSGDFNQALMDFGREICKPKNPHCDACPVANFCPTFVKGLQDQIPFRKKKFDYEDLHEAIVLVERKRKVLVRKCVDGERWAGLWDFPRTSLDSGSSPQTIAKTIFELTGLRTNVTELGKTIKHGVTKYRIKLDCYKSNNAFGRLKPSSNYCWKSPVEIKSLALSATGRKFADLFID
ncbi:MAG: A/G-specific adenine glycosylase [Planctomycetota bacterium]